MFASFPKMIKDLLPIWDAVFYFYAEIVLFIV